MRNSHASPTTVGGSSLLVIFASLCLVIFSLLSLSTVLAEERLSTASAEAVTAYYRADTEAESILAQLRAGELPPGVILENGRLHYECAISETQVLQVTVTLHGDSYEILQWQVVSVAEWDTGPAPELWDGSRET